MPPAVVVQASIAVEFIGVLNTVALALIALCVCVCHALGTTNVGLFLNCFCLIFALFTFHMF
jgi:hypothetical protein